MARGIYIPITISNVNELNASTKRHRLPEQIKKKDPYKELHNPDNHDDVITHLEPDILECEVKWALDDPEGWYGDGGGRGFRMGNMCTPVADSC